MPFYSVPSCLKFNTPVTYFQQFFHAKFHEILSGSREIGVFPRKLFCIQSQFFNLLRICCI